MDCFAGARNDGTKAGSLHERKRHAGATASAQPPGYRFRASSLPSLREAKRRSNPFFLSATAMDCFAGARNDGTKTALAMTAKNVRFRHCEKRSDEAIHSFFPTAMDCFASARNDGTKAALAMTAKNVRSVIARSEATKQSILSFRDGDGLLRWRSQ
jgi:hypothetical protein